jgi:iron complex outermembrane recepter protein
MRISHNRQILRTALALSVSLGTLMVAAPAFAQAAADEDSANKEIVVTAQFREQKLQDVPIAITAISGDALDARSQTNITEVANQAPSVTLRPTTAAFGPAISATIRGLGQIDFNPALEPGVGMYVDDVYYPRLTGANFDLLDVERIEILRGPQGTLTGRNSEGGAIKFVSRRPTGNGGGYVSGTYGSRNRINLRASADFTLTEGLFGRLSGTFADQEGYVKNIDYGCANPTSGVVARKSGTDCVNGKDGDVGYKALRGILRYNPSDKLDVMFSGDYIRDSRRSSAEVLLFGLNNNPNVEAAPGVPLDARFICGPYCNYSTTGQPAASFVAGLIPPLNGFPVAATSSDNRSEYESFGLAANVDFSLSDTIKLTSITAYREFKSSFSNDTDLSPANVGYGISSLDSWFASQELRVNAQLTDSLDLTVGGYWSDEKTTYATVQDIRYVAIGVPAAVCAAPPPPGPTGGFGGLPTETCPIFPLQFFGNDPVRSKSKAAFGTVIFKPTDAFTVTAGLRYTDESKAYTFFRYNLDGVTINPFVDAVGAVYGAGYVGLDTLNAIDEPGGPPFSLLTTDQVKSLTGSTGRYKGSQLDYRVSLDYRFSPQVLAYGTISTGFKGGGVGPRPFTADQARPFNPEKLTAFEIGVKTDLFDRRVRLNVSSYFNKFKDAQLTLLACPTSPCALPQNAGDADVKGIEAELFMRPVDGLQIDGSLSYLDWKWKCVVPAVIIASGSTTGCSSDPTLVSQLVAPPRGVTKWQWSIGMQYEADLGASGTLTPRIDVAHQGNIPGTATYPDTTTVAGSASARLSGTGAYTVANGRLTWRNADKDLDVSLEVTNMFDKYYFLSKFDLSGAGAGTISGLPGRPREWAVSIKRKF